MAYPIAPNRGDMFGLVHRPDSFVAALTGDGALERVVRAIKEVVDDSFATHPMRGGSKGCSPEWKARNQYVVEVFRQLQGDLKWSTDRALSMLRPALAAKLNGMPFHLGGRAERRSLYAPDQALAARGSIHIDDPAFAAPSDEDIPVSLDELKDKLKVGLDIDADGD